MRKSYNLRCCCQSQPQNLYFGIQSNPYSVYSYFKPQNCSNLFEKIFSGVWPRPIAEKDVRKHDFDFAFRTFRRVAAVAGVVHVVVGITEDASDRLSLYLSGIRDPGRAEKISPEIDSVFPGKTEGYDVTAGDVVDEVVEVGLAFVLGVKFLSHLEMKKSHFWNSANTDVWFCLVPTFMIKVGFEPPT